VRRRVLPVLTDGAYKYPLTRSAEDAEHLRGSVAGACEPVRHLGLEVGCLANAQDQVLVAHDEPHAAGQHLEPFEAVSGAEVGLGLRGGNDDLPR
jgi:hypothetical protein